MLQPRSGGTVGRGCDAAIAFCTSSLRSHSFSDRGVTSGWENSASCCGPDQRSKPGSISAKGSLIRDVMVANGVGRGIVGAEREDCAFALGLAFSQ
jgi:hypothetical protein